jgi:hypothetical protein
MTQLHAVLVGIDAYRARPLYGCVNDVDAVRALLVERAGVPPGNIQSLASPHPGARRTPPAGEAPATLANLRAALAELTRRAGRGDRILIYYSGHGVRVACAHPAGYAFHREALAPVDLDATAEHRLLFDHEINAILAGLAGSVTCIFDCCHAAGLTRDPGPGTLRSRSLDPVEDLRWDRRIPDPGDGAPRRIGSPGALAACHLVAACLGHEKALETTGDDGAPHGLLTSALLRALGEIPDAELWTVPWVRIWQAMRERVESTSPWQHLQMAGHLGRAVLAGTPVGGDPGLSIRQAGDAYEIDAGTLASITRAALVAVYDEAPAELPAVGSPEDLAARRGLVRVTSAGPGRAVAVTEGAPFALRPGARARLVEPGEAARLRCGIVPPDAKIAAALRASPLLEVVDAPGAQVRLERIDGRWLLTDDVHEGHPGRALLAFAPADLRNVRAVLEHYYRYALPLRMAESVRDLPGALRLGVLLCAYELSPARAQGPDLPEAPGVSATAYEVWDRTGICFRVHNTSREPLRVTLLNSAASGRVQILGDEVIDAASAHVFWAGGELGKPFVMTVPRGQAQGIDRLTAVGTTAMHQDLRHLGVARRFSDLLGVRRGKQPSVTGDRPRDVIADELPRPAPPLEQWTATQVIVRTRERRPEPQRPRPPRRGAPW